jgi:hypothetical protein
MRYRSSGRRIGLDHSQEYCQYECRMAYQNVWDAGAVVWFSLLCGGLLSSLMLQLEIGHMQKPLLVDKDGGLMEWLTGGIPTCARRSLPRMNYLGFERNCPPWASLMWLCVHIVCDWQVSHDCVFKRAFLCAQSTTMEVQVQPSCLHCGIYG